MPLKTTLPFFIGVCLFLLITSTGCTEEIITTVEVPVAITPDFTESPRSRDPYRRVYSIYKFGEENDEYMVLQGEGVNFHYAPDSSVTSRLSRANNRFPEAVSSSLWLQAYENSFDIRPISGPNSQQFSFNLELQQYVPDYEVPISTINFRNSIAAFSEDNRLLIPYTRAADQRQHFAIASISLPPTVLRVPVLDDLETFVFDIEDSNYDRRGIDLLPVKQGFLFTHKSDFVGNTVHRINYDGTFEEVIPTSVQQLFHFRGVPYAFRYLDGDVEILTAEADGRNWQTSWRFSNPIFQNYRFFPVGDDLFVYNITAGTMFYVTQLDAEGIRLEAVEFSQLETYTVTDIEEFQGNIYIATLSGFFQRDYETFRDSREE